MSDWAETQTEDGNVYWYNKKTGESSWERPKDLEDAPQHQVHVATEDRHERAATSSASPFVEKYCACCVPGSFCGCCTEIGWRGRARIGANILSLLVAIEHVIFFLLETILIQSVGPGLFNGLPQETFTYCNSIIQVQGVYNLCLALGLFWGVITSVFSFGKKLPSWRGWGGQNGTSPHLRVHAFQLKIFFLSWIIAIGVFSGIRVTTTIAIIQGVPALTALILVILGGTGIK